MRTLSIEAGSGSSLYIRSVQATETGGKTQGGKQQGGEL